MFVCGVIELDVHGRAQHLCIGHSMSRAVDSGCVYVCVCAVVVRSETQYTYSPPAYAAEIGGTPLKFVDAFFFFFV